VKIIRYFRGDCRLRLQSRRINWARSQHEAGNKQTKSRGEERRIMESRRELVSRPVDFHWFAQRNRGHIGDERRVTGLDPPRAASAGMETLQGVISHRSENLRSNTCNFCSSPKVDHISYPSREVAKLLISISLSSAFCKVEGMITVSELHNNKHFHNSFF
jgi:hypothetical protein